MYDGFGNSESDEVSKIHTIFTWHVEILRNKLVFSLERESGRIFKPLMYTSHLAMVFHELVLLLETERRGKYRRKAMAAGFRSCLFHLTGGREI